jgi:hypothetical protein
MTVHCDDCTQSTQFETRQTRREEEGDRDETISPTLPLATKADGRVEYSLHLSPFSGAHVIPVAVTVEKSIIMESSQSHLLHIKSCE